MTEIPAYLDAILTDRYRIERELGHGGMATVYLAQDLKLDRQVALKVLSPELGAVLGAERFLAEIKITARLDHPHILTLIDSGEAGGHLFYVLPYVRGESLRDLMRRETQIGIDEAIAITKQVASALDYAHKNGVVHRDIKPENILLQEGEAMLADFGIALAVKEAGGDRLTQTGLSLGTPQYMSPEQATGDRRLDARSDVYSLAAVLYEMLVGDPPMSGATVQAVIAKLLTETPTRVRVVRPSVPQGVDSAIAKALSKVPSDRFPTAGDFAKALEAAEPKAVPAASKGMRYALMAVGALVVAGLAYAGATGKFKKLDTSAALRDRRQLTFSGNISVPAISSDGKQVGYFVKECKNAACTYAVVVQDVGTTTTRRVMEGASAGYGLEWSGDRRYLIMNGTVEGKSGSYLISALGGVPRMLTAGAATFAAGGDSVLIGPAAASNDSGYFVRSAGLDGVPRDSVFVPGTGFLSTLSSVPNSSRMVAMIIQPPHGLWQVIDRKTGKVTDRLVNSCTCGGTTSADAIWMSRAGPTVAEAIVRVAIDPATGKLSTHQDTIYSGRFTQHTVTADGLQMAVDDGSSTFTLYATPLKELLSGKGPTSAPLAQGTSPTGASISPDGVRLLMRRSIPTSGGVDETRLTVMPTTGGAEIPIATTGSIRSVEWADSTSLTIVARNAGRLHIALVDSRSGATIRSLDTADSSTTSATAVPNGFAWLGAKQDRIIIEQAGKRREIPMPSTYAYLTQVSASRDGKMLLFHGWVKSTNDSLVVNVMPVDGGPAVRWMTKFADHGTSHWMADGSIVSAIWDAPETMSLYKLTGAGAASLVGRVPHVARQFSHSDDLQHATIGWSEDHGDAWLYRVVKP
jgi:hypothetical protein